MRKIILGFALAMLALLSAAQDRAAAAEKYLIDSQVWGWYQQYLRNIGNGNKPGAFAISKDGRGAFYSWCQDIRCVAGPTYSQDALNYCEREYDTECVVFAVRDDIRVEYEVAAAATSSSNAPDLAPATATKITVTPAVKSDIDAYLRNTRSPARFWALAIAKDGSSVDSASCSASGGYAEGGICEPTQGSLQELAGRKAIKQCGGAADCILLYAGEKKVANIEIVMQ
jgi:hypothetical protein